jgi:hypothetical protein
MKKPQLYLETSVWNFHFANDAPEKREITLRFFDKVKQDEEDARHAAVATVFEVDALIS